jgi:acyl-CoA thioester hydrolase
MPAAKRVSHRSKLQVRFSDCDPLRIVWHGNYVKYFEDGREDFGRHFELSYLGIYEQNGLAVPLVHLEMDYKRSAKFGDELEIETTLVDDPAAKLVFEYRIINAQQEIVCTGKTIQAFVHLERNELQLTMPKFFEAWKQKYLPAL